MWPFDKFKKKAASDEVETITLDSLVRFLGIENTSASALSEATYFACLKVMGESLGKLPLKIQQASDRMGVRVAREHPYYRMLNVRPNPYMTASTFWTAMEICRNHYGNGYAWIDTRDPKDPHLWLMDPRHVKVYYNDALRLENVPDVFYQYSTNQGTVILGSEEVIHVKSHMTLDGLVGISVREQLASTIDGGAKAQKLINKMYESGMTAKAVLQYTGSLNDANRDALVKGIEDYAKGRLKDKGVENIIPIPYGFSLTPLNLKLADSQFLELRQYSALQIASAFGVKPYQVGDYTKSSYSSAEAQQLSFLVDTLLFVVKQYEEEVGYKLLTGSEAADGYHAKFNTAAILRADQQAQMQTLVAGVSNFILKPNEARDRLDLPWAEGGDKLIGNGSTISVDQIGAQWNAAQQAATEE